MMKIKKIIITLTALILLGGCTPEKSNVSYIKDDNICAICEKKIEWDITDTNFKIIAEYTCENGFVHPGCRGE